MMEAMGIYNQPFLLFSFPDFVSLLLLLPLDSSSLLLRCIFAFNIQHRKEKEKNHLIKSKRIGWILSLLTSWSPSIFRLRIYRDFAFTDFPEGVYVFCDLQCFSIYIAGFESGFKVDNEFKNLDIAIVESTNHVESSPKERHIRKISSATSVVRPRADVAYCIHALSRRLAKTRNWNSSDCSAWVRTYALFLEERLECFRTLKYDMESGCLTKSSPGATKVHSRTRFLSRGELLDQLLALQQLLYRLMGCQVLKESFKIYCAINDGIINLVDVVWISYTCPKTSNMMQLKPSTSKKRAGQQAANLAVFYDFRKGLDLVRNFRFPILTQPLALFLATIWKNMSKKLLRQVLLQTRNWTARRLQRATTSMASNLIQGCSIFFFFISSLVRYHCQELDWVYCGIFFTCL